jgi:hypothetical protein
LNLGAPRFAHQEFSDGNTATIREKSGVERQARDAQIQARSAQERKRQTPEGEKPQAGHCDRALGGAQKRREGPAQKELIAQTLIEEADLEAQFA